MSAPTDRPNLPAAGALASRPNVFELLDILADFGRWLGESEQAATPPTQSDRQPLRVELPDRVHQRSGNDAA